VSARDVSGMNFAQLRDALLALAPLDREHVIGTPQAVPLAPPTCAQRLIGCAWRVRLRLRLRLRVRVRVRVRPTSRQ
jgi:hypothetical protein